MEAAFGDGPCTIGHTPAAFEHMRDQRVMLEALEFHVRIEVGILIIEMHHEADGNEIVFKVVHEAAATGLRAKGPAHGVSDLALLVIFGFHLPQLFHAEAKFLRLAAFREFVPGDDFLGQ